MVVQHTSLKPAATLSACSGELPVFPIHSVSKSMRCTIGCGYLGIVVFFDSANGGFRDSAIDVKGNSWDFPDVGKVPLRSCDASITSRSEPFVRYVGPVLGRGEHTVGSLATVNRFEESHSILRRPLNFRKRFYAGFRGRRRIGTSRRPFSAARIRYTAVDGDLSAPGGLLRFA